MTLAEQIKAADLEHLLHVGPVWLDDKTRLEYESGPDEWADVRDNCPGRFSEWVPNRSPRPYGFTGAAVKIARYRDLCVWWEPEREGRKVYNDQETIRAIKDAWEWGFQFVQLKLKGAAFDCLNNGHIVTIERVGIGGVWPNASDADILGYLADLRAELVDLVSKQ